MEGVVDRIEAVERDAGDASRGGERELGVGRDGLQVGDVSREEAGLGRATVTGQDKEWVEPLEAHERRTGLSQPFRAVDVREGVLGRIAGEHESKLGDPDREVILRVTGGVDELEREVAAVDRQAVVTDRDGRRCQDEGVEAAGLLELARCPRRRARRRPPAARHSVGDR